MADARQKRILWTRDELILVWFLYKRTFPKNPSRNERKEYVVTLAKMAKRGWGAARSYDSIHMRIGNFAYLNDNDPRDGLSGMASNKLAIGIWNEFKDEFAVDKINREGRLEEKGELEERAKQIILFADYKYKNKDTDYNINEGVVEGGIVERSHKLRERNPKIVNDKKEEVKREKGFLTCEVCEFNFAKTYGSHGEDFIECHHKKPIAASKPSDKTYLADLALVCSNCHRMIHRKRDCLTIEQLKEKLVLKRVD